MSLNINILISDVLHPCDIAEDTAIAYNYNNVVNRLPNTFTAGK
jgi:phenylalanyl-tRNA synthetase beta chain